MKSLKYKSLRVFGLSPAAIACYENLYTGGSANAVQLAERLATNRTGIYRVLRQLIKTGFIAGLKTNLQPTYYYAEHLDIAIERYFEYQRRAIRPLIAAQKERRRR